MQFVAEIPHSCVHQQLIVSTLVQQPQLQIMRNAKCDLLVVQEVPKKTLVKPYPKQKKAQPGGILSLKHEFVLDFLGSMTS